MKTYEELEQYLYKVCKYLAKIGNRAERDARAIELFGIHYKDNYIQEMIAIAEWNIKKEELGKALKSSYEKLVDAMKRFCKMARKTLEKAGGNDED